jgi:CAAX protease family protein
MAASGSEEVPGRAQQSGGPPAALVPASRNDATVWVVFALVGFVVGQVVALIAVGVAAGITGNGARLSAIENLAAPPAWYIASGLVGIWVGFFVGPLLASRVRGTKHLVSDFGIVFRPIDIAGIGIGIGGQLLITVIYLPFTSHLHNFNAPTTKLTGGAHGSSFLLISVLTVVGAPFFEELFFRGLLFRGLLGMFGATGERARRGSALVVAIGCAVVVDGVLFGLAHAELEQLAGLAVFGCILALVAFKTQRLGMNMVSHAAFNLVAVLAIVHNRAGVIH